MASTLQDVTARRRVEQVEEFTRLRSQLGFAPDFDREVEIEKLRDAIAYVAVGIGTTSKELLTMLCTIYHLRVVED